MFNKLRLTATGRRRFLRLAAVTGGAAAVVSVAKGALAETPEDSATAAASEAGKKSYRETAHVREYYDKARF